MINIFIGITSLFFLSSIILNLISYKKNYFYIEKYTRIFTYPLILISCILTLIQFFPDSKNIIFLLSFSLICLTIYSIFTIVSEKKYLTVLKVLMFILSNICWIFILYPSIYLYQYSKIFVIIYIFIYMLITAYFLIKILKERIFYSSILPIISLISIAVLNFFSIVTLTESFRLYSIFIFVGSSLLFLPNFLLTKSIIKKTDDNNKIISRISFYLSELLLCTGFVLMII